MKALLAGLLTSLSLSITSLPEAAAQTSGAPAKGLARRPPKATSADSSRPRVLVFSRTTGFRHNSIEPGKVAIIELGKKDGFDVDTTEDPTVFTEENLKRYHAVFFLATTGDVLDEAQQADFMRFIEAGGGYVGTHSATDTEYEWPWYGKLAGAYFDGHSGIEQATVHKALPFGRNTLPDSIVRKDEWYNYRSMAKDLKVILKLDERTYRGGKHGDDHPIAWYHDFDGGRAFYTGFGHTPETYSEPVVLDLLSQALEYAIGKDIPRDYSKVPTKRYLDETRFKKTVIDFNFDEPMEMGVMPDGKIIFGERSGGVRLYNPTTGKVKLVSRIRTAKKDENGLLGLALDPDFAKNHWVYIYYGDSTEFQNYLSRFTFTNGRLDMQSEKRILTIPYDDRECCHWAGGLAFGPDKNLYLSTGDNTNPGAFPQVDEQPGHEHLVGDAQRTSGNTNDLRGKILRIHPEPDGSYSIPPGNLFPPGEPKTRPEIYTMGLRNPWRLSIDQRTGYLYWGDVGPDADQEDSLRGPRGYDEVNQAKKAGFFGWPYFIGNNLPYNKYDYARDTVVGYADPRAPVNESPNNTGKRELPPLSPPFIWYPYKNSTEFPMTKTGGRVATSGPVYYSDEFKGVPTAFPSFFDGKLLIHEFSRGWIYLVTMDENGAIKNWEPFMPGTRFRNSHMAYGKDGRLYILEFGSGLDGKLSRIDYIKGNRAPVLAKFVADDTVGSIPLKVNFTTPGTYDPDGDKLSYTLKAGPNVYHSKDGKFSVTFDRPGVYPAKLTVRDTKGATTTSDVIEVIAGNTPPTVVVEVIGNKSFFFPGTPIEYHVTVSDPEDGSTLEGKVPASAVTVTSSYDKYNGNRKSHQKVYSETPGKRLIAKYDCMNCHRFDKKLIGPAYQEVSKKYLDKYSAHDALAAKIIKGGGGVWGKVPMTPHPGISPDEARQMVSYILSLAKPEKPVDRLPLKGSVTPAPTDTNGGYEITAIYEDKGPDHKLPALPGADMVALSAPIITADYFPQWTSRTSAPDWSTVIDRIYHNSSVTLDSLDLTSIKSLTASIYLFGEEMAGGQIEIRLDKSDAPVIGTIDFANAQSTDITDQEQKWRLTRAGKDTTHLPTFQQLTAGISIAPVSGMHRLVLTFKNSAADRKKLFYLKELRASNQ